MSLGRNDSAMAKFRIQGKFFCSKLFTFSLTETLFRRAPPQQHGRAVLGTAPNGQGRTATEADEGRGMASGDGGTARICAHRRRGGGGAIVVVVIRDQ